MSGPSPKSAPTTSPASLRSTGSQASASGPTLFDGLDGLTTGQPGREVAPAGPSRSRASAGALTTRATFGRHGFGSSASAGLTCSLVNNLIRRTRGSILYSLTWKASATPSRRLIFRLRASGARMSASDISGWPTPTTPSGGQGWPPGTTVAGQRPDGTKATVTLQQVAVFAGWSTPAARDYRTPNLESYAARGRPTSGEQLSNQVIHRGPALIGSSAEIAAGARLNPSHARWLMRLPPTWDVCAIDALKTSKRR